ncbi:DEAD/DEAH box helicase [Pseudoclavibacter sp. RFBA6]|uniref:DEAD/DEAH box helicase n=1 Tax=Pseudoclavibacter sp. RFBA6 TaxID=2080573 RepID=UPI000CE92A0D|nr:DEAD/DEAH box helicase [Pseudoclavibacter sp. RFBA6]PPG41284.1 DEAD/DEAH box helicase [Pseudoclavibacter sp. RFBA6]
MTETTSTFAELGVPKSLVSVLDAAGKHEAFPIQQSTLPSTLAGRDVLGRGKTGSGKTLAFAIPLVARLAGAVSGGKRRPGRPLGLVLLPTRELATQVAAVIEPLAKAAGLTVTTVFGGVSQRPQETAFRNGVDIVVACPGRLDDLMKQRIVNLDAVEVTVLDEADHMADLGFLPVVTRIMNATPQSGQRLLFSATLDNGVDKLVKKFLNDPILHSVDESNSHVAAMTHHVYEAETPEAKTALVHALASGKGRRIMFMRTKHQAKKLAKQLTASGIPAVDLHGNLSQNARDRNLAAFSGGEVNVLVATDVAARGVHVDAIELVVHVDPPAEHKAYLHRSGRTARAGSEGDVVTLMLPSQRKDTEMLLRRAKIGVTPQRANVNSPFVAELVGEVAPTVRPVPGGPGSGNVEVSQGRGTSQGANARRKRDNASSRGGASRGGSSTGGGRGRGGSSSQTSSSSSASRPARSQGGEGAAQGQRRGEGRPRRAGTTSAAAPSRGGGERGSRRASWSSGQ